MGVPVELFEPVEPLELSRCFFAGGGSPSTLAGMGGFFSSGGTNLFMVGAGVGDGYVQCVCVGDATRDASESVVATSRAELAPRKDDELGCRSRQTHPSKVVGV